MKKSFIVFLIMGSLFLAGCSTFFGGSDKPLYPYREISQQEAQHFIPYGYYVTDTDVNGSPLSDGGIIYAYMSNTKQKDALLYVYGSGGDNSNTASSPIKLIDLSFNDKNDSWEKVDEYTNTGLTETIGGYDNVYDINDDGISEMELQGVRVGVSDDATQTMLITMSGGKLVNLLPDDLTVSDAGTVVKDASGNYILFDSIWGEGEDHYGCHKYMIETYKYNAPLTPLNESGYRSGDYNLVSQYTTNNKYLLIPNTENESTMSTAVYDGNDNQIGVDHCATIKKYNAFYRWQSGLID